LACIYLWF